MNYYIPGPLFIVAAMTTEGASGSKLTKLVTYHVLGNIYGNELITIVHSESVTHKFGSNHRSTRPSLDHALLAALIHCVNLLFELYTNVRAFF